MPTADRSQWLDAESVRRVSCCVDGSGVVWESRLRILCDNVVWFLLTGLFSLQRGTGLSTPLTSSSMLQFKSAEDLADYLTHFRADNIVNDAEFIRVRLVPDAGPWSVLGQVLIFLFFSKLCGRST